MFIYNTTFLVKTERVDEWKSFIESQIIPTMQEELDFQEPSFMRIFCESETGHSSYAFQIKSDSLKKIEQWQALYEPAVKQKLFLQFGEEALPFSTIMEII